jgi:2-polyprenyl-3-methyl-5-hydroxy-6-metoxy-1,4-benzoquinol methylase
MHTWLVNTNKKELEYYKGMVIHADTGMHEQAMCLVEKYLDVKSTVLDLGAGSGAFSQRLLDHDYFVHAVDIDANNWAPKEIRFFSIDINHGISPYLSQKYQGVCCLEVIEHLENPWSLLRDIHLLIDSGGILILSTPNITSFLSRLIFLRTGLFGGFNQEALGWGHINPISTFEFEFIAEQTGWEIIEIKPGGYLPVFDLYQLTWKKLFENVLRGLFYPFMKGQKRGWTLLYVLKKK